MSILDIATDAVPPSCRWHLTPEERAAVQRLERAIDQAREDHLNTEATPACHTWPTPAPGTPWHRWQGRRCGACGDSRDLVTDHCHDTGLVRGFLCRSCNTLEPQGGPRWRRWRLRPPSVICRDARPYWSPVDDVVAEPEPHTIAALGPRPDDPAEAADYLAACARLRDTRRLTRRDPWSDNAVRGIGL